MNATTVTPIQPGNAKIEPESSIFMSRWTIERTHVSPGNEINHARRLSYLVHPTHQSAGSTENTLGLSGNSGEKNLVHDLNRGLYG